MNAPSAIGPLHKVVVIDDNPIIQRAVYFALRDKGCTVLMCGNITDALALVRREHPELIVLDINFPFDGSLSGDRDGFWALNWLHSQIEDAKNTPVIMISSDDAEKARPRALAAGAVAFLQKPINKDELVKLVLELVGHKPAPALPAV
ncbi:MAG TPA: response regulator [Verrucomicrobiae bacterium]|nr:response regulator [Verrucomicrobiae bacterium]